MKTLTKKRLSLLLLSSLLLEGCQTKKEISAEEKVITSDDILEVTSLVEKSTLDNSSKEIFYNLNPVLKDIQYVDVEYLKDNIKKYQEQESCFQKNGIDPTSNEEYTSFHDLLHLLGKEENEFLSDGVISILEREYTGYSAYPFEQSIVLMLIDLYGKDTVIRSFTTNPNELKEKISNTTDPAFTDILYGYFDEYRETYEKNIDDFHLNGRKKMIVAMMESLYHNQYGKETSIPESLFNLTNDSTLLEETKNRFNEEDLDLVLQSSTNQFTKKLKKING